MENTMRSESQIPSVEKILAFGGLASCLLAVFWSYSLIVNQQPVWLLPGLYLVEMVIVGIVATHGVLQGNFIETWLTIGILLGFSLMGALTIGLAFIPSTLIFFAAAAIMSRKASQGIGKNLRIGVLACAFQIVLMIVVIRI
jgi:hypothetical protein